VFWVTSPHILACLLLNQHRALSLVCVPLLPCPPAEAEATARLRLQQAEAAWSMERQRVEARLQDAAEVRAKMEAQVSALAQVGGSGPAALAGGRRWRVCCPGADVCMNVTASAIHYAWHTRYL
jgi:hypothetical protein